MKNMTGAVLFCVVALATPLSYGDDETPGVAGIDVVVKERPSERATTDARGNFALEALPPGSYTLSFKARSAKDLKSTTQNMVIVATGYSIKLEGTKHSVNRKSLTSDQLIAGVDIAVDGSGAAVHGQVLSRAKKKMVWVPKLPGTNLPGHWAEEGSNEASRANTAVYDARDWLSRPR
jgi:hypothetical protein